MFYEVRGPFTCQSNLGQIDLYEKCVSLLYSEGLYVCIYTTSENMKAKCVSNKHVHPHATVYEELSYVKVKKCLLFPKVLYQQFLIKLGG